MALSAQAFRALVVALGYRTNLAQEFANALFVPAPLSVALQQNIIDAMAKKAEAEELIAQLEGGTAGLSALAQVRFKNMMGGTGNADAAAGVSQILPLLQFSGAGVLLLLGNAATYSGYAGTSVSASGSNALVGNVGSAGSISGLSGQITGGSAQSGTADAALAKANIQATYNNLLGRTPTQDLTGQDLGGKTLDAGVYEFDTSAGLTGNLILDAQGNPNAVFIFQVGTSLTTAAMSAVTIINGGTANNVYWQVGTSATLGANSTMIGTVLAHTNISVGANATSAGGLFAINGTLTLSSNSVTAPDAPALVPVVATPTFSPVAGTYAGTQLVTISSTTAGAAFYYTTNGTTPTTGSTLYSGPISVATSETIKVLATKAGLTNSAVAASIYTITALGPSAVNLLTAANYRILTESGISTTAGSAITGDIAVSPIAHTAITGFGLVLDGGGTFSTSALVTGHVFAADYSAPTPANLTQAVSDMSAAYTDAAGRTLPDHTNLGSGNLGGLTLQPGLYKWTTGVTIPTSVTLNGGPSDVFIMQVAGTLGISASQQVTLTGGLLPQNIFWQVSGAVTLGVSSTFNGIVLGATSIAVQTTATVHGRLFAQTAVTLDDDVISG